MTIGERAKEYITNCRTVPSNKMGRLQGYIRGATEQREIDIEKACKEFMSFLYARVDNPNYQLRKEDFSFWVEDFRKAMEDEE